MHRFLSWPMIAGVLLQAATATLAQPAVGATAVTLVVPYAPGGPSDVGARRLAPELERELQRPVVVQNIAGATGMIAVRKLLDAPPDGATLLYGSQNELILAPATQGVPPYRPHDVVPVGLVVETPLVLVAHPAAPYRTADELVAYLRADPDRQLRYGSPGTASLQHLAAHQLGTQARVRMLHVPYKGVGPMLNDLLGRHIEASAMTMTGGTLEHLQQGTLRSLGVLALTRSRLAPELPTINEGRAFKGVVFTSWGGLFVSARTPPEIQARLNAAMQRIMQDTRLRARIFANGGDPAPPMSLAALQARYAAEIARYGPLTRNLEDR